MWLPSSPSKSYFGMEEGKMRNRDTTKSTEGGTEGKERAREAEKCKS